MIKFILTMSGNWLRGIEPHLETSNHKDLKNDNLVNACINQLTNPAIIWAPVMVQAPG